MEAFLIRMKDFLGIGAKHQDIASFFRRTSASTQKKVLEDVAKKANKEQKALVDSYKQK
jgi:hypothetical protein